MERKNKLKWAVLVAVLAVIAMIPCNEVYNIQLKEFCLVTAFAVISTATGMMDGLMVGILIPLGFKLFSIAPNSTIYAGWASSTPMVTFGSLLLAAVLEETGLLKRISLFSINKSGGTYKGICYGVLFAGYACSLLTSVNVMYVFAALSYGVCSTLKLKQSKASAGIVFAAMISTLTVQNAIYYPAGMGLLLDAGGVDVTWLNSMIYTAPALIFDTFILWFVLKFIIPEPDIDAREELLVQYQELGKMSLAEKKSIIILIGIMASLLLSQWTGMDTALPFLIAPWIFFLPGINIGTSATLKKVNVGMVFLVAGFLSIGNVANHLGVGQILGEMVMPLFEGQNLIMVVILTFLLGTLTNFVLTPFAMYTTLGGMISTLYATLGIGSLAGLYIIMYTGNAVFFPYESLTYLVFMSFGMMSMKDFVQFHSIKVAFTLIWLLAFMVPWWRLMGII